MRKIGFALVLLWLAACSSKPANRPPAAAQAASAPAPPANLTQPPQPAAAVQPALPGNPEPVAPPPAADAGPAMPAASPAPLPLRVPAGTVLRVRLDRALGTRRNRPGDRFTATLVRSLNARGGTLPAGTRFRGHVTLAGASGRLKGRAVLALTLDSFEAGGWLHRLRTSQFERLGKPHKRRNERFIGGGSAFGAIVGAIAGGGKGALIGAAAGAGAGAAGEAATGREEIYIPAEAALVFRVM